MPNTAEKTVNLLRALGFKQPASNVSAIIENVGGYVGGAGQPGSRAFVFGYNAGIVRGAVEALGYCVDTVVPKVWQRPLNLGSARAAGSKAAWKRKLREAAQEKYPHLRVTLKTADALLLLGWGLSRQNNPE